MPEHAVLCIGRAALPCQRRRILRHLARAVTAARCRRRGAVTPVARVEPPGAPKPRFPAAAPGARYLFPVNRRVPRRTSVTAKPYRPRHQGAAAGAAPRQRRLGLPLQLPLQLPENTPRPCRLPKLGTARKSTALLTSTPVSSTYMAASQPSAAAMRITVHRPGAAAGAVQPSTGTRRAESLVAQHDGLLYDADSRNQFAGARLVEPLPPHQGQPAVSAPGVAEPAPRSSMLGSFAALCSPARPHTGRGRGAAGPHQQHLGAVEGPPGRARPHTGNGGTYRAHRAATARGRSWRARWITRKYGQGACGRYMTLP